jgi:hypothetical protein
MLTFLPLGCCAGSNRSHIGFCGSPITVGPVTHDNAGTYSGWLFGNGAPVGRRVLNNEKLIAKRGSCHCNESKTGNEAGGEHWGDFLIRWGAVEN